MPESKLGDKNRPACSSNFPLASIIITSYNYEKFLARAIDSALQQTYPAKEIIVVDDGSTDASRHIINSYGSRIMPVFQENKGRSFATNTGFFSSRGKIIFLLDADDFFFPHKVETMVNYFLQVIPQTPEALIFHRLEMRTDDGSSPSLYRPRNLRALNGKKKSGLFEKLSEPESAYRYIQKWGFLPFFNCSTSGLSLTRSLADKIFPLPIEKIPSQDAPLVYASMVLGTVYGTSEVLASYIIHGKNICLNPGRLDEESIRIQTSENFINNILQKMNKGKVASFYTSRRAQAHYRHNGSTRELLKLAYQVPARCLCWGTIWFSLQTLWYCLNIALGSRKIRRETKEKLLAKTKQPHAKQHSRRQPPTSKCD